MQNVIRVSHPLIEHSLTILRDKTTDTAQFRQHATIVSKILIIEATKDLLLRDQDVETPLASIVGKELKEEFMVVPVLRAGLAMLFAVQDFLPAVSVGFIGLERDENTATARKYYQKLPQLHEPHEVIILDPMLATGGSVQDVIESLTERNVRNIKIACIVAAPEGIERINKNFPEVHIYTSAIDSHLNSQKYIVPGLGDFGDRYFGTQNPALS